MLGCDGEGWLLGSLLKDVFWALAEEGAATPARGEGSDLCLAQHLGVGRSDVLRE